MKKIITVLFIATITNMSFSQNCNYDCQDVFEFMGDIDNKDINNINNNIKPSCFYSEGGRITNNLNFNNQTILSFSGTIRVDKVINMNRNNKIYTNGNINLQSLSMSGNDTLFNIGDLSITRITANNPGNTIITDRPISIGGRYYDIGGSIPNCNIVITSCINSPLPIKIIYFKCIDGTLTWNTYDVDYVVVQGSRDGVLFEDLAITSMQSYNITTNHNYFRLHVKGIDGDETYSDVVVNPSHKPALKYKILDLSGREIEDPLYYGFYIIWYSDNSHRKIFGGLEIKP